MNRRIKFIIFTILAILIAFTSYSGTIAQGLDGGEGSEPPALASIDPAALVGFSFTYQGLLKNNGAPVNGRCDLIFDLYATSSGGVSVGTDSDPNVLVTNGLFTDVIDIPTTAIDGNARFMEIQIRCPAGSGVYTTLTPRQELEAVPYALGLRLPFSHTVNNSTAAIFAIANDSTTTSSPSILGSSAGGEGVRGLSTGGINADNGVYGETNSNTASEAGIKGVSTDTAAGGYFTSTSGNGVYGSTDSATNFGGYFLNGTGTTSGGAIYANGDAKQSLASDGFVKAGVLINCMATGSNIQRVFNNVNTATITVLDTGSPGDCTVDFGFDVFSRFVSATPYANNVPRYVTYSTVVTNNNWMRFFRYDQNGNGSDGGIMILIY